MYINESDVKKLKQGTGCGLVDCRRALTICNGNYIEAWRRLIYPQKYNFTITREDIMPEDKVPNANKLEGEVIRVVDTDTISISGLNRLNPRIQVIKISNLNSISNQYSLPSGIYPGDILFKHPFLPNTYINSSISEQEFFKQKIKCIASICQELGAKSISGKAEWIESKKWNVVSEETLQHKQYHQTQTTLHQKKHVLKNHTT